MNLYRQTDKESTKPKIKIYHYHLSVIERWCWVTLVELSRKCIHIFTRKSTLFQCSYSKSSSVLVPELVIRDSSSVWSTVISGECSLTVTLPLLVFSAGGDWWEHCYHRRGPPGSHTHHRHRLEPGTNNTRVMTVLFYDHIGIMTRDDVVDSRLQSPMLAETRCCVLKCVGMRSPDWLVTILLHRYQPDQPVTSYHHYPAPMNTLIRKMECEERHLLMMMMCSTGHNNCFYRRAITPAHAGTLSSQTTSSSPAQDIQTTSDNQIVRVATVY